MNLVNPIGQQQCSETYSNKNNSVCNYQAHTLIAIQLQTGKGQKGTFQYSPRLSSSPDFDFGHYNSSKYKIELHIHLVPRTTDPGKWEFRVVN